MTWPGLTTLYFIHLFQLIPILILGALGIRITLLLWHATRRSLFTSKDVDWLFRRGLSCWRFIHHIINVADVLIQIVDHAIYLRHHGVSLQWFALITLFQETAVVLHDVMVRVHAATNTWTGTSFWISSINDTNRFYLSHRISLHGRHKVIIIDIWSNYFRGSIFCVHFAFPGRWIPLWCLSVFLTLPKGLIILIVVFIFIAIIWIASAVAFVIFFLLVFALIRLPVSKEFLLEVKYPWMLEYLYQWDSLIRVLL